MRDLKAVTQENKTVKQDVLPIFNQNREIIAVLIREKDISKSILEAKKYKKLEKDKEKTNNILLSLPDADTPNLTAMREIHHRVKNNLQMVASILNLQSRKTDNPEVKRAFKENTTRVLSIAAIHDILTNINQGEEVSLKPLLEKIRRNVQSVSGCDTVLISIAGDDICLSVDKATSVALVVNELLSNALEHAFPFEKKGHILIRLQDGALYGSISVEDDGEGFDSSADHPQSLGLAIVSMTVKDKLKGELRISSSSLGTKAMFDFKK